MSNELRHKLIDIKCPDCGEIRQVTFYGIRNWANKHGKSTDDYSKEIPCKSCVNVRHGCKKRDLHYGSNHYEVKCCKCGEIRKVKAITINTWIVYHPNKTVEDYYKENLCRSCAIVKDGIRIDYRGYSLLLLKSSDPYISMCPKYKHSRTLFCLEHRYVMAQILGRPLEVWEVVHHKDGNKLNNAPNNLELVTRQSHLTVARR